MSNGAAHLPELQRRAVREFLRVADVIDELGARFRAAGHELALVGGSVRDALLGRMGHDLDLTTSARPDETEQLVSGWADAVWAIGREFGTIGLRKGDWTIEITTYRADNYDRDSRKPEVRFGNSLVDDLVRRDFTINAMALMLPDKEFVDPFDGRADLAAGRIRTPGRPQDSFTDDPLRMMRAARFASQLSGRLADGQPVHVAPEVVEAIRAMVDRIEIVSAERVRDELVKLVLGETPRVGLQLLVDSGLADRVLPEVPKLRLELDEHHRHKDVYEHTLKVLEQAIEMEHRIDPEGSDGPNFTVRFAALMHDIGKPRTRRFESGGRVTFHHHEMVGAKMTRKRMRALKFSNEETENVSRLVELHLRFHGYGSGEWTDSAVRRYVRDAGPLLRHLHVLTRADSTTRNRRKAEVLQRTYDDLEARIERLEQEEELAAIRPDLDGNEIMQILELSPGPMVGKAWKHLLEVRLDSGPMSKEAAREQLLRWWSEQSG